MKIGVPKEIKPQENRIGLTPESVKTLVSEGHEVIVEDNGGFEAGFENEQYTNAGAKIANTAADIFNDVPKNWLCVSTKKDLLNNILKTFKETDFAITDLSHSKAIIEIEGQGAKEVLKKGCPFNFNTLEKNSSINSTYNGIAFTVDMLDDNPHKVRLFTLRSFGESLYHSITDASLEFGFKSI